MLRFVRDLAMALSVATTVGTSAAQPADTPHHDRVESARQALRARDWAGAVERYRIVVRENPFVGMHWEAYAVSLHALGQYDEARPAFERCIEIGYRLPQSMYNIACGYALQDRTDEALEWLTRAYAAGFIDDHLVRTDRDLDPLRDDARFRVLVGMPLDDAPARDERWRRDLAYLERRLRELHWDLDGVLPAAEFDARIAALHGSIARLDDNGMRYEIQKLLAAIGDGHTSVVPDRLMLLHGVGRHGVGNVPTFYPLELWQYEDDVYVNGAVAEHAAALGARVLHVGGVSAHEALRRVDAIVSRDNVWGAKWVAMDYLCTPGALRALGLVGEDQKLDLEVETPDGERRRLTVRPAPMHALASFRYAYAQAGGKPARYQRGRDKHYWMEHDEDLDLVWVQFNVVRDMPGESLAQFATRVAQTLRSTQAGHLVIDLRHNHGGNGHLTRPLLHAIIRDETINETGRLFVVVGRETFSAAMNFATALEQHTAALFVGEPTGSRPNFVGESSLFGLPYSKLWISCSTRYFQGSDTTDTRHWIGPDIPAPITPEDYRANRDPVLEAIARHIRQAPAGASR